MLKQRLSRTTFSMISALFILALNHNTYATVSKHTIHQRTVYQDAELALKKGRMREYRRLEKQLRDYPLYPYLKYKEIMRNLSKTDYKTIHRFVEAYPDTPLGPRLKHNWLKTLAKKKQWKTLIAHYYHTSDIKLQCDFARALIETGEAQRAYAVLEGLWLTGKSLPKRCDYPISRWHKSGELIDALVWERIRLSMQSGNPKLALHISKYLSKEQRYWVRIWGKVRRDPDYALQVHKRFKDNDTKVLRWILGDGIRGMARKDAETAAQYWYEWRSEFKFTDIEKERVERRLTYSLFKEDPERAKQWLSALDINLSGSKANILYIIHALDDQDWDAALDWIGHLALEEKQTERWIYWRARALEATGLLEESRALYLTIADERSYYGFLAADRAGMRYQLKHQSISYSNKDMKKIASMPPILRAQELRAIGKIVDARREWAYAMQYLNQDELIVAAQIAHDWDWHDRVIVTLAQAKYWDDIVKRFPLAHRDIVVRQSRLNRINPAWAFAIIRQESAFTQDARSHAGAMGLMQLMPRTAKQVARKIDIRYHRSDLLQAETNIQLGVSYLKYVNDKFSGNNVLATAAYNAGGHRVKQWLPKDGLVPADIWIESVPFEETRKYLQRVMTYTVIYEERLGQQPVPLLDRMLPISSPINITNSKKTSRKGGA